MVVRAVGPADSDRSLHLDSLLVLNQPCSPCHSDDYGRVHNCLTRSIEKCPRVLVVLRAILPCTRG